MFSGCNPAGRKSFLSTALVAEEVLHMGKEVIQSRPAGRRTVLWAAACVLAVGTVGCTASGPHRSVASLGRRAGARSGAGAPLSPAQNDRAMMDFTRCLRTRGVDEPDPYHRPGHVGLSVNIPTPGPATNAALAACNHFIAPIAEQKQATARRQLAAWLPGLTHYAECMRAHGIPMLDPDTQGSLNLGRVAGLGNDVGRYSPQFAAADSTCRHLLPAAVHDDGTGP
jgi:hypothetical protein